MTTAANLPEGLNAEMVTTWITTSGNVKRHPHSLNVVGKANGWTTLATVGAHRVILRPDGSVSSGRAVSLGGGNFGCEVKRLGRIVDGVFVVSPSLSAPTADDLARFAAARGI